MRRWIGAAALLAAALLYAPRVAYVTSDSMEPVLSPGDGFLVLKLRPRPGAVVVYRPVVLPAEYVVHRVVAETPAGLITRGDASPATDQATGEPPVTADRVLGVVPAWRDRPLSIPGLQLLVERVRNAVQARLPARLQPWIWLAAALPLTWLGARPRRRELHSLWRARAAAAVQAMGLAVSITALVAHASASGMVSFDYLVTESPGRVPHHVGIGSEGAVGIRVRNPSLLPVTFVLQGVSGTTPEPRRGVVPPRSELSVTARVPPQQAPGWRKGYIQAYMYPWTAPPGVIYLLHYVHPVAALAACAGAPLAVARAAARLIGPDLPLGRLLGMRRPR